MTTSIPAVRSPGDLLAVLPYVLGFHPRDSIVVAGLRDHCLGFIQRHDLPQDRFTAGVAHALMVNLLEKGFLEGVIVGYESRLGESDAIVAALAAECRFAGVDVLDPLIVRDGCWRLADGSPHPDGRWERPIDASRSATVAELVGLGIAPLVSRGAVVARVDAEPGSDAEAVVAELPQPYACPLDPPWHGSVVGSWARIVGGGPAPPLDPGELAMAVASLRDHRWRDGLIAWVCAGALPLDKVDPGVLEVLSARVPRPCDAPEPLRHSRELVERHLALCRRFPDRAGSDAAAILTVTANLCWFLGDGVLATSCLDRALRADPGYRLALLLDRMTQLAIRPGSGGADDGSIVRTGLG